MSKRSVKFQRRVQGVTLQFRYDGFTLSSWDPCNRGWYRYWCPHEDYDQVLAQARKLWLERFPDEPDSFAEGISGGPQG